MSLRVIRAAAGCGKTTALAAAYLELVAEGTPVDRIVAITFTRRAAAELVERVGLALRAAIGDELALQQLGSARQRYLDAAPSDPEVARQALADLGSAPIGTTDHFVNLLLAEFALDAALPLPDGSTLPLDIDLVAVPDLSAHLDTAARLVLDPPENAANPDMALLTRYFTLGELLAMLVRTGEVDSLPIARSETVLVWLAQRVADRLQTLDLPAIFKVEQDTPQAWMERIAALTNKGVEWTHETVARWFFEGAIPSEAPIALVPWIRKTHRGRTRALWKVLQSESFDLGITEIRMDHVLEALKHPYENPDHLTLADDLREAVNRLRVQVTSQALESAALQGELPHTELTRAAAHLCRSPAVLGRYGALLVDEIQDASPDQLDLYGALAAQPGTQSVFVGDGRQSIYLFRGGEPEGLERLTREADTQGAVERLMVNRRSTPALVAAHRALFACLEQPFRSDRYTPLEALDDLEADPHREADQLSALHSETAPVLAVHDPRGRFSATEIDEAAVLAFWDRLKIAWTEPGHERDTAAVLCPTWRSARRAQDLIRRLAGDDGAAWVEGGDSWLGDGVGRDVGFWLRALLDPNDDVAWLAVWKHPSVGLTDGALARVRAGTGLEPDQGWNRELGYLVRSESLQPPQREDDRATFDRVRGALTDALDRIGRDDTSLVLDRLFTALDWRTVYAAGPGGIDTLARLEVLLDWIGELDASGASVDTIATLLTTKARSDVPRVRLERPERTVTCTTVFQAKGLAWDHVAVLSPGRAGRLDPDPEDDSWMRLDGQRIRLLGLTFDPEGGLVPYHDPLRRLSVQIRKNRFAEEGARLAYVAITRARRSVTFGIPNRFWGVSPAQRRIAEAWKGLVHETIAVVPPQSAPSSATLGRVGVHTTGTGLPMPLARRGHALIEQAPSAAASRYTRSQRQAVADHVQQRVLLGGGFVPGAQDLPPPHALHPQLSPADWGVLAHGWFAAWAFRGPAKEDAIDHYLLDEWGSHPPSIRSWLLAVSVRLGEAGGPLWDLVTDPASTLLFEYPLVGIGGPDDNLLLSGRIDLLVRRKRRLTVIDFKAGNKSPKASGDIEGASLKTYGPQLDAYRGALERMQLQVDQVALWFVRTGAAVIW